MIELVVIKIFEKMKSFLNINLITTKNQIKFDIINITWYKFNTKLRH